MIILHNLVALMRLALEFYLGFSNPLMALALLSFTVFLIMLPLYSFGDWLLQRENRRKQRMQNELASIVPLPNGRRKHSYTQEVYRRYGYNPLYGLVGLFGLAVQLPFFVAAYYMLRDFAPFNGLAAGPVANLSLPDGLLQFAGITVNVLPLLMTLLNLLASYYYAASQNGSNQQPKPNNIWLLPALFLVILYAQPSGLVLYWSMSNIWSLLKHLHSLQKQYGRHLGRGWLQAMAIRQLSPTHCKAVYLGHKVRAAHIGLLFMALCLSAFYFVETGKDKPLPLLWIGLALFLLLYLGGYYMYLVDALPAQRPRQKPNTRPSSSQTVKRRLVGWFHWLLLGVLLLLFLRLLQLHWHSAAFGTEQLAQLLALQRQAQGLRHLAWFAGLALVLYGQARIGWHRAWLWCPTLMPYAIKRLRRLSSYIRYNFWNSPTKLGGEYLFLKRNFYRYVLALSSILLGIFGTVPARVIASDPASFEGNSNYYLIVAHLAIFFLLGLGLFVLLYGVLPKVLGGLWAVRYYASCLAACGAWFFSANVLLLPGNYGPLVFTSFRNPLVITANAVAGSMLLLLVLLVVLFCCYLNWHCPATPNNRQAPVQSHKVQLLDRALALLVGIHLLLIADYSYTIYQLEHKASMGNGTQHALASNVTIDGQSATANIGKPLVNTSQVQLSRNGRNVIILMLDQFTGGYVPSILQAQPELATRLDGFVFYPNAVSQSQRTYGGFHPIVGGSEYTIDQMNANKRPLVADIIEAFTMIPKALNQKFTLDQQFAMYFVNVEYVIPRESGGTMLRRLAEERVQLIKTQHNLELLPPALRKGSTPVLAESSKGSQELDWQNFLSLLGLFQAFGPIFRAKIYNHGKWMGLLGSSDVWASAGFWRPYVELLSLRGLFTASEQLSGAYVLFHNLLPHNTGFVGAEKYFANPANFHFTLPEIPQVLREQDEQNSNRAHSTVFLAYYSTLYLVAGWLDALKRQGLYDNTEIFLVSDHGNAVYDFSFGVQGRKGYRPKSNWHGLYMHKAFGSRGPLQTSPEFRTTADVPAELLPSLGIHHNPYSGKPLEKVSTEPVPLFVIEGVSRGRKMVGNDYQYYIHSQYNLHNRDIFKDSNWQVVH